MPKNKKDKDDAVELSYDVLDHCGLVSKHLANKILGYPPESNYVYELARKRKIFSRKVDGTVYFSVLDCWGYRFATTRLGTRKRAGQGGTLNGHE